MIIFSRKIKITLQNEFFKLFIDMFIIAQIRKAIIYKWIERKNKYLIMRIT